jgi:beta-lactamase regulating signal transducer with metallopeptidase domain
MNLPNYLCDGFAHFSAMPAWGILLFKATLILSIAWLIHFSLARANPRWRIFLWRGVVVGLALSAIWTLGLPGFEIRALIPEPVPIASPSSMQLVVAGQNAAVSLNTFDHPTKNTVKSVEYFRPSVSWQIVLLGIWSIGMAALVLRLAIGYIRLRSLLLSSKPVPEAVVAEARRIAAGLGCRRAMRIHSSRQFAVPFLCGLLRPVVILPERMCETTHSGQLSGILAHELAHTRSFDLLWNAVIQVISIVLWFHPMAWRMGSAHRSACDAVCDAISASFIGDVQDYCRTLARVALEATVPAISFGLSIAKGCDVRRRLAVLKWKVFAAPLKRRTVIGTAIVGLILLTLFAGLRFSAAAQTVAEQAQNPAEDMATTPCKVFEEVINTYKTMDTYKAEGTVAMDIDSGSTKTNTETSFSIALKKPNLYLVTWTQKNNVMPNMAQTGAVWSDGDQPYLYMGVLHAYSKMSGDEIALGGAAGISNGATSTIPSLFLKQQSPFSRLKDPEIEQIEKIDGEDCYVISGASIISTKETWWISKSKHFIVKYSRSLSRPEGGMKMPEQTDEQLEESLKRMGVKVTEESKKHMRDMLNRSRDVLNNNKLNGTSTEMQVKISSPDLSKKDFQYAPPKVAELKESLFGGILGGQSPSNINGQPAQPTATFVPGELKSPIEIKTETDSDEQISLPTLEQSTCREELEAKIKAAKEKKEYRGNHIVLGRLILDGPGDVRDVGGQMEILSDGYFAGDTDDLIRPIGFRLHGYAPLNIELKGRSGKMVDLGTIHMTPLPASELLDLTGTIALEGEKDVSKASVGFTIEGFPINTPTDGISPRKHWAAPIKAKIDADGRISASGFSPCPYYCAIKAPGYVTKDMTVTFKSGQTLDIGNITLEKPKQIELTYIVAEKPPFDAAKKKNTTVAGGERWKATKDIYGWDLEFAQVKGDILFNYSYAPCYLKDLGEGKIEDFIDSELDTDFQTNPDKLKVQSGHVYLLNQEFWKRWVIVKVNIK